MNIKNKKSETMKFLDQLIGEPETFGNLLEALRKCDGISQTAFAKKLSLSRAQLCDIERGRKRVSPERAAKFAVILSFSERSFIELALQDLIKGLKYKVKLEAA